MRQRASTVKVWYLVEVQCTVLRLIKPPQVFAWA